MPPRTRKTAAADPPAGETPEVSPVPEPADPAPLTPPDEATEADTEDDEPLTDAAPLTPPAKRVTEPEVKQDPMTPPPPPAVGQEGTLDLRRSGSAVDVPLALPEVGDAQMSVGAVQQACQRPVIVAPRRIEAVILSCQDQVQEVEEHAELGVLHLMSQACSQASCASGSRQRHTAHGGT
nr:hypothetical protein [Nonomuraea aurantiaca]